MNACVYFTDCPKKIPIAIIIKKIQKVNEIIFADEIN